ncbi:uncharacterized protein CBL_01759 [Carabus blaptoides fortunei]
MSGRDIRHVTARGYHYYVDNTDKYMYSLMAGLWGVADAVWHVQINAMSGILFPGKEASYSNFRLWEATGSVITHAYSPYLCTRSIRRKSSLPKIFSQVLKRAKSVAGFGNRC